MGHHALCTRSPTCEATARAPCMHVHCMASETTPKCALDHTRHRLSEMVSVCACARAVFARAGHSGGGCVSC
jgi:hypothetical protein